MDAFLQAQLTMAALSCSVAALFFSLVSAFPGLKDVLAAIRDGVLWFALFLVLGGAAFVLWQEAARQPMMSITSSNRVDLARPVTAEQRPQRSN